MKREFTSLSPQEALHVAIFIEERNHELYRQFADLFQQFGDPDSDEIADVFLDMAEEERGHGTLLQERYAQRYGEETCKITEEDIRELIEVPRLENDIFAIARAGATASPRHHALEVALAAEEGAERFYARLMEHTEDPDLYALYRELAAFENEHVALVRRKMEAARRDLPTQQA